MTGTYIRQTVRTINTPSGNPRAFVEVKRLWEGTTHRGAETVAVVDVGYRSPTQALEEDLGREFARACFDFGEVTLHKVGEWKRRRDWATELADGAVGPWIKAEEIDA